MESAETTLFFNLPYYLEIRPNPQCYLPVYRFSATARVSIAARRSSILST